MRVSFILSFILRISAAAAQSIPKSAPIKRIETIPRYRGRVVINVLPTKAAANAPQANCPSPPAFASPTREGRMLAIDVIIRGVARTMTSPIPYVLPKIERSIV